MFFSGDTVRAKTEPNRIERYRQSKRPASVPAEA
jgi:hypothetical protein